MEVQRLVGYERFAENTQLDTTMDISLSKSQTFSFDGIVKTLAGRKYNYYANGPGNTAAGRYISATIYPTTNSLIIGFRMHAFNGDPSIGRYLALIHTYTDATTYSGSNSLYIPPQAATTDYVELVWDKTTQILSLFSNGGLVTSRDFNTGGYTRVSVFLGGFNQYYASNNTTTYRGIFQHASSYIGYTDYYNLSTTESTEDILANRLGPITVKHAAATITSKPSRLMDATIQNASASTISNARGVIDPKFQIRNGEQIEFTLSDPGTVVGIAGLALVSRNIEVPMQTSFELLLDDVISGDTIPSSANPYPGNMNAPRVSAVYAGGITPTSIKIKYKGFL